MIAFNNVDLLMLLAIFFLLLVLIFTSVAEMGLSRITRPKAAFNASWVMKYRLSR